MHESERLDLIDCIDCGATLSRTRDRGYAVDDERMLCLVCARRRGGQFDEEWSKWSVEPELTDLPPHSEV